MTFLFDDSNNLYPITNKFFSSLKGIGGGYGGQYDF